MNHFLAALFSISIGLAVCWIAKLLFSKATHNKKLAEELLHTYVMITFVAGAALALWGIYNLLLWIGLF